MSPITFGLKSGSVQVYEAERIVLAHEPDFVLGRLRVSPSRRELVRDDGAREVLEHRVIQVLVALAKAAGTILTRDELTLQCWEGRVVGEDAINRVISRLRKAAGTIGAGSFDIETITKIGYRLTGDGITGDDSIALVVPERSADAGMGLTSPTRRSFAVGALIAGIGAIGGGALLYRRFSRPSLPPEVPLLMAQGAMALEQPLQNEQHDAIGAYRRVVEIAPDYADGWGMLGYAYGFVCHYHETAVGNAMRIRAQAAARHAFELDRGNVSAILALAVARPFIGQWLERERGFRHAIERQPDNTNALRLLAVNLIFVGRSSDAVPLYSRISRKPLAPGVYANYIEALWNAGRLEEADRAAEDASSLYPSDPSIWQRRYDMLRFGGHADAAIAMLQDPENGVLGLDKADVRDLKAARAIESRDRTQIRAAMDGQMRLARLGSGYPFEAVLIANALGRVDEAFAIAEAYYFGRGFVVPERHTPTALFYSPPNERQTRMLFDPVSRPMRADRRFSGLVDELGLERYWRDSGSQPDYRRA
jgi:DNA-binding winged helix-turn-helix (wHTH) protein/tetratricopeptide (TPR) repeat protein